MTHVAIILMGLLGVLAAPLAVFISAPVTDGQVMLVIAAPWDDPIEIITNAGAEFVGPETAPFAAFAASDTLGLQARLMRAGAWAVLDGQKLSNLCGV